MHRRLLCVLLLQLSVLALAGGPHVRVLLGTVQTPLEFVVPAGHSGAVDSHEFRTPMGLAWPLELRDGRLLIDGQLEAVSFTIAPDDGSFQWEGRTYSGALRFLAHEGELLAINVLPVEEYLRGVVPSEMMASWPMPALEAQAVASRTYTLHSLEPGEPYDICATFLCQEYGGLEAQHPRTDEAIRNTAGLVLSYEGALAKTYYHADSGGATASSSEVWGEEYPYLYGRDDVPARTPHRSWRQQIDGARLAALLREHGYEFGTVTHLEPLSYSPSGRVTSARIVGTAGSATVSGPALTNALRGSGLRSTRLRMSGPLLAQGDGWGHGVGMSQYGARQLALSGYDYRRILEFYYPLTLLESLESRLAQEQR